MADISSGMSSSIMQLYLRAVLDAFLHPEPSVRHYALGGVVLTLSQGLVHPVQVELTPAGSWGQTLSRLRVRTDQMLRSGG